MHSRLIRDAAASLGATEPLIPVLDRLFAGLHLLGSSPKLAVGMLRQAGIGGGHSVLDLGCGKGAAAIAVAEELGCRCVGVDAVPSFIDAARRAVLDTKARCAFHVGDVTRYKSTRRFEAAMMLGLFDAAKARRTLRKHVRPGGVLLIDDAVTVARSRPSWLTLDAARAELQRQGDAIIAERISTPEQSRRLEARLNVWLSANAKELSESHPRLKRSLAAFLANQQHAARLLRRQLRPVQWAISVSRQN